MTRLPLAAAVAVALVAGVAAPAQADFIISFEPGVTLSAGSAGTTIDVFIRTDAGTQDLDSFGVEFRITAPGATQLRFLDPQSEGFQGDPDYVFFGMASPPPVTVVNTNNFTDDTLAVSDFTTGGPAAISTSNRLLARLEVIPGPGSLAPAEGEVFTISITPGGATFFVDANFTEVPFTSTDGAVTVGPAAVPEPAGLLLAGMTVLLSARRLAHRR